MQAKATKRCDFSENLSGNRLVLRNDTNVMMNFKPGEYVRKMFLLLVTQATQKKKNPSSPNRSRTYDLLDTSPDALPLSYRRLVGAKVIKLGYVTNVLHTARTEMSIGGIFAIIQM